MINNENIIYDPECDNCLRDYYIALKQCIEKFFNEEVMNYDKRDYYYRTTPFCIEKALLGAPLITRAALQYKEKPNARYMGKINEFCGYNYIVAIREIKYESVIMVNDIGEGCISYGQSPDDIFVIEKLTINYPWPKR